jgi:hypothetical protein
MIVDVKAQLLKRAERRKARQKAIGQDTSK